MIRGWKRHEGVVHRLFEAGVLLKGVNAAIEATLGVALLFVNVGAIVQTLTQDELVEDPSNFLAAHLHSFAASLSPQAQTMSALYLLVHGAIKAILVWGLLREKLWAFPASLAVLALFVAYQSITFVKTHSIPLLLLTLFDLGLIWLIFHEYRVRTRLSGLH
jgi:uncharacterized membrane protein